MDNQEKNNRPFVFLCTAMSLDGKICSFEKKQSQISSDDDRTMLYDHRVNCDAVMIGGNTLILDDSGLTVKSEERQQQRLALGKTKEPAKIVIISDIGEVKVDGDFVTRGNGQKIIFTTKKSAQNKIAELKKNCDVYVFGERRVDLVAAMEKIYELGIKSVLVEGGGELIFSLLQKNLVNEINLKIGNLILGGRTSATLVDGDGFMAKMAKKVKLMSLERAGDVLILKYKVL